MGHCLRHSSGSYAPDHPKSSVVPWLLHSGTRHTRGYLSCSMSTSRLHCVRISVPRREISTEIFACCAASAVSSPNSTVVNLPFLHSTSVNSVAAASAGALATLATQPFDVMKTKMQVRSEVQYHGLLSTVRAVWQVSFRFLHCGFRGVSLTTGFSIEEWLAFSTARRSECLERYSARRLDGLYMKPSL